MPSVNRRAPLFTQRETVCISFYNLILSPIPLPNLRPNQENVYDCKTLPEDVFSEVFEFFNRNDADGSFMELNMRGL